jgi:tetratricopeptide (TPR) repeat protein
LSCKDANTAPSQETIRALQLKEGTLISCGPPEKEFGVVVFGLSSKGEAGAFDQGLALLHSFEYDEAEKVFAGIIARDPGCAMAYWGVAMSNFHPLWAPPTLPELKKGAGALAIAESIAATPARERDYIQALSAFYSDWEKADHATRTVRFEHAMEILYKSYPSDKEAAILYTLALTAAADPKDKTRAKQRKAGALLEQLYPGMPEHPGIIHYIIHTYDYPELAELALPAAKRYAQVAPSSAHALHMPSHIFTRLGLWDDCIRMNLVSVSAAQCYAQAAGIRGHWDEELHGMDYLVYGYLQKGQNSLALGQLHYLLTMDSVSPMNFKVAYAFAAIPARYFLERRDWKGAAELRVRPAGGEAAGIARGDVSVAGFPGFPWKDYPWLEAIVHFARGLGAAHLGRLDSAAAEVAALKGLQEWLTREKDAYKAGQVMIQLKAVEAWLAFEQGRVQEAVDTMRAAANLEDNTEKHPVTPCEVLPARELLGDLLLEAGRPAEALIEYTEDLRTHPRRLNGLHGAGLAAQKAGDETKAREYFMLLRAQSATPDGQ